MLKSLFPKMLLALICITYMHANTALEDVLDLHDKGISIVEEDRVYLNPDRLYQNLHHHWFFQTDLHGLMPIRTLLCDHSGFYVQAARVTKCREGHDGIYYDSDKGEWRCNVPACKYYWQKLGLEE